MFTKDKTVWDENVYGVRTNVARAPYEQLDTVRSTCDVPEAIVRPPYAAEDYWCVCGISKRIQDMATSLRTEK